MPFDQNKIVSMIISAHSSVDSPLYGRATIPSFNPSHMTTQNNKSERDQFITLPAFVETRGQNFWDYPLLFCDRNLEYLCA